MVACAPPPPPTPRPPGPLAPNRLLSPPPSQVLFGSKGAGMFNHMDTLRTASFQIQLAGVKRWHICGPSEHHKMYEASDVNAFAPDYDRYPLFLEADCYLDEVRPCTHAIPDARRPPPLPHAHAPHHPLCPRPCACTPAELCEKDRCPPSSPFPYTCPVVACPGPTWGDSVLPHGLLAPDPYHYGLLRVHDGHLGGPKLLRGGDGGAAEEVQGGWQLRQCHL
jgi:hypothetical protein